MSDCQNVTNQNTSYLRRYHIWTLIDLVCDCQDTNKNICDSATTNTTHSGPEHRHFTNFSVGKQ